jgi:hypothetical protein
MFKNPLRPAVIKKPAAEKEVIGQFKHATMGVGHKAPMLSRLVGKM